MIFNVLTNSVDIHQMYICIWDACDYELRISHCFEKKHGTSPILIQLLTFLDTSIKFNNCHAIFLTYLTHVVLFDSTRIELVHGN